MEKLCGACSKETGMPKELRIELAMSRIPNVVYTCPNCKEEHSYQVKETKKINLTVAPIIQEPEKPKKAKRKQENEQEQLSLF